MRTGGIIVFVLSALLGCANELGTLLRCAVNQNPDLAAQREVVEQSRLQHRELLEALDPTLYASAGGGTRLRSLPATAAGYQQPGRANALEGEAGIVLPVAAGAYLSAGAVTRRVFEPEGAYDPFYQNLAGVSLLVPLWRDRGFAMLGYRRASALATYNGEVWRLRGVAQSVRHQVELAYINACEALAAYEVTRGATARFERLAQEARDLAGLETIPKYQVQETERDLQVGREDEEVARSAHLVKLAQLAAVVGLEKPLERLSCTPQEFLAAAAEIQAMPNVSLDVAFARRGDVQAVASDIEAAEAQRGLYEEEQRDEVNLGMGVNWEDDSRRGPYSSYRGETRHHWGGEVVLSWTRPLGRTGSEARAARWEARVRELTARLRAARVSLASELSVAERNYKSALERLKIINAGVEAARQTVAANQERFRLGEGSSKDVLDAQKNLTTVLQRQTAAAAALLRARADLNYAMGYPDAVPAARPVNGGK